MVKYFSFVVVIAISLFSCKSQHTMTDKSVVKEVNIEQFLGKWYEIARFDHKFERNLVGVTAHYSWRDDGMILVVNSGFKDSLSGPKSEAIGKAKIPNPATPAKLKVSFFWIFYADYLILELDSDYQWALIGSKSDNYLWVLSRTPELDTEIYKTLLNNASKRGYQTDNLIKVPQLPISKT